MKIINLIKNIILDIIIVILILTIFFNVINKNKPTPLFGYYFFTVMSGSMQPTLNVEDNIIVKGYNNYEVGDIVTYKKDNIYVTHRITKIDGNKVTTKGDYNDKEDEEFDVKNILGKVIFKSILLNFLVKNRIIILIVIILIYLIELIIKSIRKKAKNNEK